MWSVVLNCSSHTSARRHPRHFSTGAKADRHSAQQPVHVYQIVCKLVCKPRWRGALPPKYPFDCTRTSVTASRPQQAGQYSRGAPSSTNHMRHTCTALCAFLVLPRTGSCRRDARASRCWLLCRSRDHRAQLCSHTMLHVDVFHPVGCSSTQLRPCNACEQPTFVPRPI